MIDGKAFGTLPGTEIDDGLSVGDLVEVHFSIDDGSLVAYEIEAVDDDLDDGGDLGSRSDDGSIFGEFDEDDPEEEDPDEDPSD